MRIILTLLITFSLHNLLDAQNEQNIIVNDDVIHLKIYGSGIPVLIINGGPGMNSDGFQSLAKIIGQSKMAIIYDQRGTGQSTLTKIDESTISMNSMVNDIEIIRNHLKLDKWIVFGHSFGGMLGSYYASKFPNRVQGLILSSSGGIDMRLFSNLNISSRLSKTERDSLNYWNNKITEGDTSYHARLQRGKFLAPAYLFDKSNVPIIAHRLTQGDLNINQLVFQNMRKIDFNCAEELKKFTAPVLIIQGKQDIIPENIGSYANNVLPNSTLVIVEKCGHYGWLDNSDKYFKSINRFLENFE
ncbi:MAG: alpha/beta hydrolase [Bacteroidota bacterium]